MKKNMNRRNRRQRILIAYAARTVCALILILMIVLMGCGCLYIYEHLNPKESENTPKAEDDIDKNNEDTNDNDNELTGNENTNDGDSDENSINTSAIPFTEPDATNLTIVLDAGHGGGDGGTVGQVGATEAIEKDINLSVVKKMKALLEECGATVILTRDSDERLSLEDRSYISNQTGANLFVSIHCNSFDGDTSVSGLEFYHHKKSETSKQYAESMIEIANRIGNIEAKAKDRYDMEQNYQVLRDSAIPAVLVELGYLTNFTDCQNLINPIYQDRMAETLVTAIVEVLKQ